MLGLMQDSPQLISSLIEHALSFHASTEIVSRLRSQGRGDWGVDLKLVGDDGQTMPWDGRSRGHLQVRGPWIASGYFKGEGGARLDAEGFFPTGDVATIDPDGYLQLVDRARDVIKSGGEFKDQVLPESRPVP